MCNVVAPLGPPQARRTAPGRTFNEVRSGDCQSGCGQCSPTFVACKLVRQIAAGERREEGGGSGPQPGHSRFSLAVASLSHDACPPLLWHYPVGSAGHRWKTLQRVRTSRLTDDRPTDLPSTEEAASFPVRTGCADTAERPWNRGKIRAAKTQRSGRARAGGHPPPPRVPGCAPAVVRRADGWCKVRALWARAAGRQGRGGRRAGRRATVHPSGIPGSESRSESGQCGRLFGHPGHEACIVGSSKPMFGLSPRRTPQRSARDTKPWRREPGGQRMTGAGALRVSRKANLHQRGPAPTVGTHRKTQA